MLWLFVGPTGVYLLDFFCSGIQFNLLSSPFQGGTSFVDLLCFCSVLCLLCFARSVYMCFVVTCWERADLLALVCGVFCEFVTFPLVSWVRCGT